MFGSAVFVNPKPTYGGMPNISIYKLFLCGLSFALFLQRKIGFEGEGDEGSGT